MDVYIQIAAPGGSYSAYIARPEREPAPVVVVLHEVFGVNADIRATCDELAAAGFIALAPELYWRQRTGLDLNLWSADDWKVGLELNAAYDRDQGVKDIGLVIQMARTLPGSSGMVGVMGFCIGGLMSFLVAAREQVDAAVAFHGGETEKYLGEAKIISSPIIMHLGGRDEYISPEAQSEIQAAVRGTSNFTIYQYSENYHAFARHSGSHYDAKAAALANERTYAFFAENLQLR